MKAKYNFLSVFTILILAVTLFMPGSVYAAGTTVVKSSNVGVSWFTALPAADTRTGGNVSFVMGPATAPLGLGSLQMTTTDANGTDKAKAQAITGLYVGTPLSSITSLSYSAYRDSTSTNSLAQTISLNIAVDFTGDGSSFTTLVFEPVYQSGGVGAMQLNTWQIWDAYSSGNATWWSTKPIPGVCDFNCFVPWSTILANNPNAKVKGIFGFNVGSGWGGQFKGAVDALSIGVNGDITTYDFEPEPACTTVCYVDAVNGNDANGGTSIGNAKKTIQAAIDAVNAGGEVRVLPGNYNETALNRQVLNTGGIYQFGLFIGKNNVTIQGVTAGDIEITDPNNTNAHITTNATNNFGASGIFVQGDNVTLAGLQIRHNIPGDNKTIEIIGDGFTLKDSYVDVTDGGSVYFNDWQFDTVNNASHIQTYTIDNNLIDHSTSIDITSGAGYSGPTSGRQITNNVFENSEYWPSISFNGSGTGVPWFVQSVGGAVIQGNTFTNTYGGNDVRAGHIRVRGAVDNGQFDWTSYWSNNTFNKAVVILESTPFNVRQYNYASGTYSFDVRRIGVDIQSSIDKAVEGDTVLISAGTFKENVLLNKRVSLVGAGTANTKITNPATGDASTGVVQVTASGLSSNEPVLLKNLSILPSGRSGISIGKFTQSTGINVSYLTLDNVDVVGTNLNPCTEQERGLYVDNTSSLQYLLIKNSSFDNLTYGWYFHKAVSTDTSTVQYITVQDTTFVHNNLKGIYAEKLEDATFTNIVVDGNGFRTAADLTGCPYFQPWQSGVDINLKAGTYQNIAFVNPEITDNGLGAKEGVGLAIKARNDGTTYGPFPGVLDNVLVTNAIITGNERGIRIGEPGKSNTGPTNVNIYHSSLAGNVKTYIGLDGSAYGAAVNQSTAAGLAETNWWGSNTAADVAAQTSGTIDYTPWLCSGTDTSTDPGFQPSLTTLCPYQFISFSQPIDMNAINIAKAGQTIPVKWRLTDANGLPVSDPASFVQLHVQGGSCPASVSTDAIENYSAGSGLQYLGDGYWQFNWKTLKSATGCRSMYVEFVGGVDSPTVTFQFK